MSQNVFSGVLTAVATPFLQSGGLDLESFGKLLSFLKTSGTQGIVVAGTTGESPTLTLPEKEALVAAALLMRTDDFKVYVGTGSNSTAETIQSSKQFANFSITKPNGESSCVDGVMAVVPYYNKPTQNGLLQHFAEVAKALGDKHLCLYNVPGRTGAALEVETALELFRKHTNIVAIKEAAGNVNTIAELACGVRRIKKAGLLKQNVEILSGDDATFAPALLAGASGIISVASHLIPKAFVDMLAAAKIGDLNKLQSIHLATYALNRDLFCAPNPIGLKWALAKTGRCQNTLRLPLLPLEEKLYCVLEDAMRNAAEAGIEF